jgi:hypothetical protein
MRTHTTVILAGIALLAFVVGCSEAERNTSGTETPDKTSEVSSTPSAGAGQPSGKQGEVVETMNSGGYTYVLVDAGGGPAWYAGPPIQVAVGETVVLPPNPMPMRNFESPTLGRTFDLLYLVGAISKVGGTEAASAVKKAHATAPAGAPDADFAGISKAEGGLTVAEIFKAGAGGAGREVVLRGKVVKYNAGIMGKNWLHVRDGTGEAGTNDLTVTTLDRVKVGDTVLVTGKVSADRDFGHGYKYALLIEEAKLVVE